MCMQGTEENVEATFANAIRKKSILFLKPEVLIDVTDLSDWSWTSEVIFPSSSTLDKVLRPKGRGGQMTLNINESI